MKQPEGFPQGSPDQVLRLLKAIYGLRQSPRLWNEKLNSVCQESILFSILFYIYGSEAVHGCVAMQGLRLCWLCRAVQAVQAMLGHAGSVTCAWLSTCARLCPSLQAMLSTARVVYIRSLSSR